MPAADATCGSDERRRKRTSAGIGAAALDPDKGYCPVAFDPASPEFSGVLGTCRRLFAVKQAKIAEQMTGMETWSPEKQAKFQSRKQSFYRHLLKDEDLRRNPDLVDFALSDQLLRPVTQYLGMVPYLTRVDLVYSVSRGTDEKIESQLFHLDHEGLRQVKYFIYVYDVDEPEGPFTFLPADTSFRVVNDVRSWRKTHGRGDVESRRYLDEEIAGVNAAQDIVTVKGPVGSGVAVDTSRCLHLGSRCSPGAFRLVLYLQVLHDPRADQCLRCGALRPRPREASGGPPQYRAGRARADQYEMSA